MTRHTVRSMIFIPVLFLAAGAASASEICDGYGPQTPRDIDNVAGTNARVFAPAPPSNDMNLCNIHFHAQAEHRAAAFSLANEDSAGYRCNATPSLTQAMRVPLADNQCEGVRAGDTIEMHWVYSSCAVEPGEGLGSCLSDACANPQLRVETQVFLVVNDSSATDLRNYDYAGPSIDGIHQPKALPMGTGGPVEFLGSTTGPSYTEQKCSPLQVTWSVRPECARVDIASLSAWCADNVFGEDSAHGVRELVTDPRLLAPIR